jgi:hypothetical protein
MKFLNSWSIDLSKVPTYSLFKKPFTEDIDVHLAKLILQDTDPRLTQEIKNEFAKVVRVIDPATNILKSIYSPRYDLGRRYAEYPDEKLSNGKTNPMFGKVHSALISQPRLIKNTIFKYHDYIDIDQKKGHPTIILCNAKKNNLDLPAYEEYLFNFDYYVDTMARYYSVTGEEPINKKDIKLLFNRTIYGGGHENWVEDIVKGKKDPDDEDAYKRLPKKMKNKTKPHEFYTQFYEETRQIIDLVYSSNKQLAKKICKDIPNTQDCLWKKKSRTMSYFCGIVENEITYQAYKYLQINGHIWDRHVDWGLDGLTMPAFTDNVDTLHETIDNLNEYVRKMTKFEDVEFVVKDFDESEILHNSIDKRNEMIIDEDNEDVDKPVLERPEILTFKQVSDEFEKNHCKIVNKAVFVKQTDGDSIVMSKTQFVTSYEHLSYQKTKIKGKEYVITDHQFIKDWLMCNDEQRKYEDMGIYPNPKLCPQNIFNMWTPFAMERVTEFKYKPEALETILNHIKILCNHNNLVYDYFCKWIGQMLKHPEVKSGVCPTLISQQGSGKGTLMYLLSQMMGTKKVFETTLPSRDVWGDFNGQMANSYLVNLNELSKKETLLSEGQIKGLITDSNLTINNKGVQQFGITSYHRFMITTNNEEPIIVRTDDRRNLIIRSSDEMRGNRSYFTELYAHLTDKDVVKTCYEYFINLKDLDKFGSIPVPITEYQQDMQANAECPIMKWLTDYIKQYIDNKDRRIELLAKSSFAHFKLWCEKNSIHYEVNCQAFGLRLKRMNLKGIIAGRHTNQGNTTYFDIDTLREELKIGDLDIIEERDIDEEHEMIFQRRNKFSKCSKIGL